MLMFQICVPFAIEHFKLRATIKALLHQWFTAVGWALSLTDFLLPRPGANGGQENGNLGREGRLNGQQGAVGQQGQALVALADAQDMNRGMHAIMRTDVTEEYDVDEQVDSE